ncbi:MAG: hypothetical protein HFJ40_03645 [Clostridia bacterium]|nr:hypothetical protein [Clostridia bacterium]
MYNLNKKQKIVLAILAIIITIAICYYVYAKDNVSNEVQDESLEIEEMTKDNNKDSKEEYSDTIIIVHVTGAVNNEGIVELKVNSRISDAIDKAGGLKEDANINKINLAYVLEDGMKIYVPSVNDKEDIQNNNDNTEEYIKKDDKVNISNNKDDNTSNTNSGKTLKVNINNATQTQLEELPGIGPSTALKIIQYRNEKGKFKNIEDIKEVSGIGESKYNKIKDLITIK